MVSVPDVQSHLIFRVDQLTTIDLSPTGHAWAHLDPIGSILVQVAGEQRSWTNERHLPGHNVEKLGRFVEARSPQEATEVRYALLIRADYPILYVLHCSDFIEPSCDATKSRPNLPKDHRRPDVGQNTCTDEQEQWGKEG